MQLYMRKKNIYNCFFFLAFLMFSSLSFMNTLNPEKMTLLKKINAMTPEEKKQFEEEIRKEIEEKTGVQIPVAMDEYWPLIAAEEQALLDKIDAMSPEEKEHFEEELLEEIEKEDKRLQSILDARVSPTNELNPAEQVAFDKINAMTPEEQEDFTEETQRSFEPLPPEELAKLEEQLNEEEALLKRKFYEKNKQSKKKAAKKVKSKKKSKKKS